MGQGRLNSKPGCSFGSSCDKQSSKVIRETSFKAIGVIDYVLLHSLDWMCIFLNMEPSRKLVKVAIALCKKSAILEDPLI